MVRIVLQNVNQSLKFSETHPFFLIFMAVSLHSAGIDLWRLILMPVPNLFQLQTKQNWLIYGVRNKDIWQPISWIYVRISCVEQVWIGAELVYFNQKKGRNVERYACCPACFISVLTFWNSVWRAVKKNSRNRYRCYLEKQVSIYLLSRTRRISNVVQMRIFVSIVLKFFWHVYYNPVHGDSS